MRANNEPTPQFAPAALGPTTITWIGSTSGFWDDTNNWSTSTLPGPTNDVIIDVPAALTVTHRSGVTHINTLQSTKPIELTGGTLTISNTAVLSTNLTLQSGAIRGGMLTLTNGGRLVLTSAGGTLDGVRVNGDLDLQANQVAQLTVRNGLELHGTAWVGNATNGNWAALIFAGTQTLSGNGTVVFGNSSRNTVWVITAGTTLTLGPDIIVRGHSGEIGQAASYWGGPANVGVVNQGVIAADVSGGSININAQPFVNNGLMRSPGGTINLTRTLTTSELGSFDSAGGVVRLTGLLENTNANLVLDPANLLTLQGGTIHGGTVTLTNGGRLVLTSAGGTLDGVRVNGDLDLQANQVAQLTVRNGLELHGTAWVGNATNGNWAALIFAGTQTLSGNGTVVFGNSSRNTVWVITAGTTLTLGPDITVRGHSGEIGQAASYWGGPANVGVVNQGTIAADVSGGTVSVNAQPFLNQGTAQASNGGALRLNGNWSNSGTLLVNNGALNLAGNFSTANLGTLNRVGGTVNLLGTLNNTNTTLALDSGTGSWTVSGGAIRGGTVTELEGARLLFTSAGCTLDGVRVNGDLDLQANQTAQLTVVNGLELHGTAWVGNATNGNWAALIFAGTQTLSGNGTVVFGNSSRNTVWVITAGTTLTLGPDIIVRGHSGEIGQAASYWGGPANVGVVNQGVIAADVSGGSININAQPFVNNGLMRSPGGTINLTRTLTTSELGSFDSAGGVVRLTGLLENTNANLVLDPANLLTLQGGTIHGGTVTLTNGGRLVLTSAGGTLDGVRVNGDLDLQANQVAQLTVRNGLELHGTAWVGNATNGNWAALIFAGTQTLSGNGTVVFGNSSRNTVWVITAGTTLTLGPDITVRGHSGEIGQAASYWGGPANVGVVNQGTIAADVSGGTVSVNAQPFLNQGTAQASNGGALRLNGNWSNSGTLLVNNGALNLAGNFSTANLGTLNRVGGTVNLLGTLNNTNTTLALDSGTGSWTVSGGAIRGGTVTELEGARLLFTSAGCTLDGVRVNGDLDLQANQTAQLTVVNGLELHGTAWVGNATNGNWAALIFAGTQTLSGNGTVVFGNSSRNTVWVITPGTTLTLGPDITVRGHSGEIGQAASYWGGPANVGVVNQGVISADFSGGPISISGQNFSNAGTVQVRNNARINVPNGFSNLQGGIVAGQGTLQGNIVNAGVMNPGDEIGTLNIQGNFTQTASGVLNLQLGGSLACDEFDRLVVSGAVNLGGTLNLMATNNCAPTLNQMFPVLGFASRSGDFATVNGLASLARSFTGSGLVLTQTDSSTLNVTLTYTYDKNGNRTAMTDPTGVTTYTYDELNRLVALTNSSNLGITFAYDALGRRTRMNYPNGVETTYAYDAASQLLGLVHRLGAATNSAFFYGYNRVGNRTNLTQIRTGLAVNPSLTYVYDQLDQLVQATHPLPGQPDETFLYDPVGNRLRRDGQAMDAVHDAANRLLEDQDFRYAYDLNGNLTNKVEKVAGATTRYVFDAENKLRRVDLPDGGVAAYRYDGLERRIERMLNTSVIRYTYHGRRIHFGFEGETNSLTKVYTHGTAVDEPIVVTRYVHMIGSTGEVFHVFYHADGLSSVIELSGPNASSAQSYAFTAFGQTLPSGTSFTNVFTFTARELDQETGLLDFRARHYDPHMGRFISQDPIGFAGRDVNLYRFVENNPANFIDPLGLYVARPIDEGGKPATVYLCGRPVEGLFGSIGLTHQYICLKNSNGGTECFGIQPTGSVYGSDSRRSTKHEDFFIPGSCQSQPGVSPGCVRNVYSDPLPQFSIIPGVGKTCQQFTADVLKQCK